MTLGYRSRRRLVPAGVILLVGLGAITGCDDTGSQPSTRPSGRSPRRPEKGFIAFVGAGEADPLWSVLRHGAEEYNRQFSSIEVRFLTASGNSIKDQENFLRGLDDSQMRGLCIQVTDPDAISGAVAAIESKGVVIIPMIHRLTSVHPFGFAGLDDEAIGTALADNTARILQGKGSIMVLHAGSEHSIYGRRLMAFEKEIKRHPSIEVFASVNCHGDAREARRAVRERAERFPRLSAWVSVEDWLTRDLISESQLELPPECKLVQYGGTPDQWPLLRSGRCPVIITSDLHETGVRAIQFCETGIRKPSGFETEYRAPLRVIEPSNLPEFIADWNRWTGSPSSKAGN